MKPHFSSAAACGYLRLVFCQQRGLRNESVLGRSDAKMAILCREGEHVSWLEQGGVFD